MPSLIGHAVVGASLGVVLAPREDRVLVAAAGAVVACLPDLDVVAFAYGIPYGAPWGHRGAGHSLVVGAALGLAALAIIRRRRIGDGLALVLAGVSHGLLDAMTNGGLGIALLWPWSSERWFFGFRPIAVSPIGVVRFFSSRGVAVLVSELVWVIAPCALLVALRLAIDRIRDAAGTE